MIKDFNSYSLDDYNKSEMILVLRHKIKKWQDAYKYVETVHGGKALNDAITELAIAEEELMELE